RLHDYFGRGPNEVMHRLRAIRDRVLAQHPDATEHVQEPQAAEHVQPPEGSAPSETSASAAAAPASP
ncbi:MAG: hypothetical protein ACRDRJ_44265, partial [Streptosporangiaceae bacterium]